MYACVCLRMSCIGMYTCKHMRRGPSSVHMIFDVFYISAFRIPIKTIKTRSEYRIFRLNWKLSECVNILIIITILQECNIASWSSFSVDRQYSQCVTSIMLMMIDSFTM